MAAILLKNKRGSYKSRAHHAFFSEQFWNWPFFHCLIHMAQTPIYYRPPTKLRESNAFSHVCLFTRVGEGIPMWPLIMMHCTPLYRVPLLLDVRLHCTTPPHLPTWDPTTGGFPDMELHCTSPPPPSWHLWPRFEACGTHPPGMPFRFLTETGQSIIVQSLKPRFTNISDENLTQTVHLVLNIRVANIYYAERTCKETDRRLN